MPQASSAHTRQKTALTLNGAKSAAAAARAKAQQLGCAVAIAVVDDAGHLLYLERDEGTVTVAIDAAIGKGRTAAVFRKSTRDLENSIDEQRTALLTAPAIVALGGGLPIEIGGQPVGGIGVSGATSAQDIEIAEAGLAALR